MLEGSIDIVLSVAIPADRAGDSAVGEDPGKGRLDTSPPKGALLLHKVVNQETASAFLNIYLFS